MDVYVDCIDGDSLEPRMPYVYIICHITGAQLLTIKQPCGWYFVRNPCLRCQIRPVCGSYNPMIKRHELRYKVYHVQNLPRMSGFWTCVTMPSQRSMPRWRADISPDGMKYPQYYHLGIDALILNMIDRWNILLTCKLSLRSSTTNFLRFLCSRFTNVWLVHVSAYAYALFWCPFSWLHASMTKFSQKGDQNSLDEMSAEA